jgi:hypothetical protein
MPILWAKWGGFYEVKENLIPQVSNIVCGFER